jgi:hypothetical protein
VSRGGGIMPVTNGATMPSAVYDQAAPDGMEQVGWSCVYHDGVCHNPLDCDLVPLWRPARDARDPSLWRRWREMDEEDRADVRSRGVPGQRPV